MANLILPARHPLHTRLREPALLAPGRQDMGHLIPNNRHELGQALVGYGFGRQPQAGIVRRRNGYTGLARDVSIGTTTGVRTPTLKPVSHLLNYSVVVFWTGTLLVTANGSVLYCERPNSTQIFKLVASLTGTSLTFVTRSSTGTGLINMPADCRVPIGDGPLYCGAFAKFDSAIRYIYTSIDAALNSTSSGGEYNYNVGQLLADPEDAGVRNDNVEVHLVFTFNRGITREEFDRLRANPWGLLKPANQSPYLISIPGGATATLPTLSAPTLVAAGGNTYQPRVTATYS